MPGCESGCLCDGCCAAARAFAYGHWNLHEFDDHAESTAHDEAWNRLDEGFTRAEHRLAA